MGVPNEQTIHKYSGFYSWLLLDRQVKKSTAQTYIKYHKMCTEYLNGKEFNAQNLQVFFAQLRERCTPTYINHYRDYARIYTRYLIDKNLPHDPEIFKIKKLKEIPTNRATMSDEEIESFLKLPPKTYYRKHWRTGKVMTLTWNKGYEMWTLFFSIMAYTGMRPNEVASLTVDSVDFGRSVFIILAENSKTGNFRSVPIPPNLKEVIKKHINTIKTKHLFMQNDKVFNSVDWGYNFHQRITRLGIKRKGLSPYSLRHSFITRLIEEDVNLFKVQKIVGHTRIDTTAKYTHLSTKDMQKTILQHPAVRKHIEKTVLTDMLLDYIKSLDCNILNYDLSENILRLKLEIK